MYCWKSARFSNLRLFQYLLLPSCTSNFTAKAKTTTQFVCREAPLMLPEPGTIVIYDSKDNSELDLDMLQVTFLQYNKDIFFFLQLL